MCKWFGLSAKVIFGFVVVSTFMMTAFAEVSSLSSQSILVDDPMIEKIIAEEFLLALSDGTLDVGGMLVKTEEQILSSDEDLKSILVYRIQNFLDYDFATNGMARLINEAQVHYETLLSEQSALHSVVMSAYIKDGNCLSGFRADGYNSIKPLLFNELLMAEYLNALGVEHYDEIHYVIADAIGFSGILVKSQGAYWILPFEIRYAYFKFARVKVMEADVYFDELKSYIIEQKRMEQKKVGLKRLGWTEINPSQWILKGGVGFCLVWIVFGVLIIWNMRMSEVQDGSSAGFEESEEH